MYRLKQSARVFGQSARAFGRQFATLSAPRVANTTLLSVAIGAGVGVLAVSAVQAATSSSSTENGFKDPVRKRLQNTYGYVAVNLAATAGAAAMLFRSGVVHRLMAVNPIVLGIGSVAAMIGSMYLTRSIDYHESPFAKHLALSTFVGCQALMMAPLASLGGPLLMRFGETISFFFFVCVFLLGSSRAALATGAVVGAISLTAATAPSQAYLSMTGPLAIGGGLIFGASLGSMFFPGANFLYSIVLWGGLALHGGMVFARTQNLIDGATRFPNARFDPINDSLGIYIDSLAIFWRMATILSGGGSRRK